MANFNYSNIKNLDDVKNIDLYLWELISFVTTTKKISGKKTTLATYINNVGYVADPSEVLAHEVLKEENLNSLVSIIIKSASSTIDKVITDIEKLITLSAKELISGVVSVFQTPIQKDDFIDKVNKALQSNIKSNNKDLLDEILNKSEVYSRLNNYLNYMGMTEYTQNVIPSIKDFINNASEDDVCKILGEFTKNNLSDDEILSYLLDILEKDAVISFDSDAALIIKLMIRADKNQNSCVNYMINTINQYCSLTSQIQEILKYVKTKLLVVDDIDAIMAVMYYCSKLQGISFKEITDKYANIEEEMFIQVILESL